ncbi:MAG: hypothetical protein KDA17_05025 [Candidatus Saccharibacteria bacterium]|nr:hypothetical protein [Candidatus Saccharibacteria bacterium]
MANVLHSSVTGADLHEPKGISSANDQEVYVADGAGSGAWAVILPIGTMIEYSGDTEPTGWLFVNGDTIGNASSNATGRANADTATLFGILWERGNTHGTLAIYDSAGAASTFGASSAADYAANKAIALPDHREKVVMGYDDKGSGTAVSTLLDTSVLGDTGGSESFTLAVINLPEHVHDTGTYAVGSHSHSSGSLAGGSHSHGNGSLVAGNGRQTLSVNSGKRTDNQGSQAVNYSLSNSNINISGSTSSASVNISGSTSSATPSFSGESGSTGSGTAKAHMAPTIVETKLIFYGV